MDSVPGGDGLDSPKSLTLGPLLDCLSRPKSPPWRDLPLRLQDFTFEEKIPESVVRFKTLIQPCKGTWLFMPR